MRPIHRLLAAMACLVVALAAHADGMKDAEQALLRKDYLEAARLLEPLAKAGDPRAQLRLGELAYFGHGQAESDQVALEWFDKAARQGLAEAQLRLGHMYAYGQVEVEADADPARLAAQWYFEAARQGLAEAQFSLGVLFLTGAGVHRDPDEALRWMQRAAAQGHADAAVYVQAERVR